MTNKDNHINRHGEQDVRPAHGKAAPILLEDEYGMTREEELLEVDWSHDPRSESANEHHNIKGPIGWPSDESIKKKASLALYLSPDVDATAIVVEVERGLITLSGHVLNRSQKKAAEYCISELRGVRDVMNKLVIVVST